MAIRDAVFTSERAQASAKMAVATMKRARMTTSHALRRDYAWVARGQWHAALNYQRQLDGTSVAVHSRRLANAERDVAQRANEARSALEYFIAARDVRNAGEYRDDLRAIVEALDEWSEATQAALRFSYTYANA